MGNLMRLYKIDTLAMKTVNDAPDNVSIAMLAIKVNHRMRRCALPLSWPNSTE
jgi:hypothetical protein